MTQRTHVTDATVSNTPRTGVATSREVADFLRTTEAQLARLRWAGTGPSYIRTPGGRTIRYRWEDVDRWLDAGKVETGNGGQARAPSPNVRPDAHERQRPPRWQ